MFGGAVAECLVGTDGAVSGMGMCERCNYVKESPGWRVSAGEDENGVHTAEFVTPTGARSRNQNRHRNRRRARRIKVKWR